MYKKYTIKEFIAELQSVAKELPNGENSLVTSGDFEGNYTHKKHELQIDEEHSAVFIAYEMHEGHWSDDLTNEEKQELIDLAQGRKEAE